MVNVSKIRNPPTLLAAPTWRTASKAPVGDLKNLNEVSQIEPDALELFFYIVLVTFRRIS